MKKYLSRSLILIFLTAFTVLLWANWINVNLVSDTSVIVYGPIDHYVPLGHADWGTSKYAVLCTIHPSWPVITDAYWISTEPWANEAGHDWWRLFHAELKIPCVAYNLTGGVVLVTSDNAEEAYLNGNLIGSDGEVTGAFIDNHEWATVLQYDIDSGFLQPGINSLDFIVRNYSTGGPTGLVFKVDGVSYEVPDVVWQPPIANLEFELKDGTTLPIKFKLYLQDETLITDMKNVYVKVHQGTCNPLSLASPAVETWSFGEGAENLRFDQGEFYYIINFQTKNYTLDPNLPYAAVVYDGCTQEVLGCISFFVSAGKGNRRN